MTKIFVGVRAVWQTFTKHIFKRKADGNTSVFIFNAVIYFFTFPQTFTFLASTSNFLGKFWINVKKNFHKKSITITTIYVLWMFA